MTGRILRRRDPLQHAALVRAIVDLDRRVFHLLGPELLGDGEVRLGDGAGFLVVDAEADHFLGRRAAADADEQLRRLMKYAWQVVADTGDAALLNSHYPILRLAPYGPGAA